MKILSPLQPDNAKSPVAAIGLTRAALVSLAAASGIIQGAAYLITDENRFAVGLSATTYQDFAKASEGKLELIATVNASATSSISFTLPTGYASFRLECSNLYNADIAALYMQTATDGGTVWDTGANYATHGIKMTTTVGAISLLTQNQMQLAETIITSSGGKTALVLELFGANDASVFFKVSSEAFYAPSTGVTRRSFQLWNTHNVAEAVNAIKLYMATGVLTGDFRLSGVKT